MVRTNLALLQSPHLGNARRGMKVVSTPVMSGNEYISSLLPRPPCLYRTPKKRNSLLNGDPRSMRKKLSLTLHHCELVFTNNIMKIGKSNCTNSTIQCQGASKPRNANSKPHAGVNYKLPFVVPDLLM